MPKSLREKLKEAGFQYDGNVDKIIAIVEEHYKIENRLKWHECHNAECKVCMKPKLPHEISMPDPYKTKHTKLYETVNAIIRFLESKEA